MAQWGQVMAQACALSTFLVFGGRLALPQRLIQGQQYFDRRIRAYIRLFSPYVVARLAIPDPKPRIDGVTAKLGHGQYESAMERGAYTVTSCCALGAQSRCLKTPE